METKKELQKEFDYLSDAYNWDEIRVFVKNVKAIVARMPDDKSETKPEPSLLEVAMNVYCGLQESTLKGSFDAAELIIAENERRKK